MPFWEAARQHTWVRCFLVGANAASIGLVFAACVTLFFKFCHNSAEAACMLLALTLVKAYKWTPPLAIFAVAALCLCLFLADIPGIRPQDTWCHIPNYGHFATQDLAKCAA